MKEGDYRLIEWLPEMVASFVVSIFVGAAVFQWVLGEGLSEPMLALFGVIALTATATIFGVDKFESATGIWFGGKLDDILGEEK